MCRCAARLAGCGCGELGRDGDAMLRLRSHAGRRSPASRWRRSWLVLATVRARRAPIAHLAAARRARSHRQLKSCPVCAACCRARDRGHLDDVSSPMPALADGRRLSAVPTRPLQHCLTRPRIKKKQPAVTAGKSVSPDKRMHTLADSRPSVQPSLSITYLHASRSVVHSGRKNNSNTCNNSNIIIINNNNIKN